MTTRKSLIAMVHIAKSRMGMDDETYRDWLAKNTGKVLTHNYLLNEVWGSPAASDTPSLRVFMATLRKKIEEDPSHPRYIQTHIGVGYRMIRQ